MALLDSFFGSLILLPHIVVGKVQPPTTTAANLPAITGHRYGLKCRECSAEWGIPENYSVDPQGVKIALHFVLDMKDFFTITDEPISGSRSLDISALHAHMLWHFDPLFLIIEPEGPTYKYAKHSAGHDYWRSSRSYGPIRYGPNTGFDGLMLMLLYD